MTTPEEEELYQQPGPDPQAQEFLALLAGMPWLLRQYFADSLNLLETEGRLAFRSLVMVIGLTLFLIAMIAGSWMALVLVAVYWAVTEGVALWLIVLTVIGVHIVLVAGVIQQILSLARFLLFPNSRRALANLATGPRPATSPLTGSGDH
ncbi:hypothetical protein F6455_13790 [Proteobacteria bacterium 005FR1]|nr:hypothetical protein [Proteobacteria bacterium 005FR1]